MPYSNPDGLIAAAVIVQFIVLSTVILRFVGRRAPRRQYFIADWLILVTGITSTGLVAMQICGVADGMLGTPLTPRLPADPEGKADMRLTLRRYEFSSVVTSLVTTGLIKISVSLFYLRIFSLQKYRRVIQPWIALLILWTVGFFITHLAICGSAHGTILNVYYKDPRVVLRECGDGEAMGFSLVTTSAVTDLITVLLPIPMLWTLRLSLQQKISLAAIFLIGLISVGASAARAYIYFMAALTKSHTDYAIGVTSICVWNLIEIQMGIIAACAPTLRPIAKDIAKSPRFISLKSSAGSVFSRRGLLSKNSLTHDADSSKRSFSLIELEQGKEQGAARESVRAIHVRKDITVESREGGAESGYMKYAVK